jgi:hypothetical protein
LLINNIVTSDDERWLSFVQWLTSDVEESRRYHPSGRIEDPEENVRQLQEILIARLRDQFLQNMNLYEQAIDWLEAPSWPTRLGAIKVLSQLPGGPSPEVVQRMVAALGDRRGLESYPARLEAATFLINRDPYSQLAIELCLDALQYGTRPWDLLPRSGQVRQQAAFILGKLEPLYYDERVYQALRQVMYHDADARVRDAAYGALLRMARVRETRPEATTEIESTR